MRSEKRIREQVKIDEKFLKEFRAYCKKISYEPRMLEFGEGCLYALKWVLGETE